MEKLTSFSTNNINFGKVRLPFVLDVRNKFT